MLFRSVSGASQTPRPDMVSKSNATPVAWRDPVYKFYGIPYRVDPVEPVDELPCAKELGKQVRERDRQLAARLDNPKRHLAAQSQSPQITFRPKTCDCLSAKTFRRYLPSEWLKMVNDIVPVMLKMLQGRGSPSRSIVTTLMDFFLNMVTGAMRVPPLEELLRVTADSRLRFAVPGAQ